MVAVQACTRNCCDIVFHLTAECEAPRRGPITEVGVCCGCDDAVESSKTYDLPIPPPVLSHGLCIKGCTTANLTFGSTTLKLFARGRVEDQELGDEFELTIPELRCCPHEETAPNATKSAAAGSVTISPILDEANVTRCEPTAIIEDGSQQIVLTPAGDESLGNEYAPRSILQEIVC
jgi:hypothetical protein